MGRLICAIFIVIEISLKDLIPYCQEFFGYDVSRGSNQAAMKEVQEYSPRQFSCQYQFFWGGV